MELVPLLRLISRRRLLLVAGLVVAVALAVVVGSPPPASSAVAWTRVALDTPRSQLVDSAPSGADSLPWRASLLTHLMTTDQTQRELAQRLHVRPDEVTVVDPMLATPIILASVPKKASDVAAVTAAPYILTLSVTNASLPMISVEAAAPDRPGAVKLAQAAVALLESHASPEGTYSSLIPTGEAAKLQPFLVQDVAAVRVKIVTKAAVPMKQVGAPLFLLGMWVLGVLFLPRLLRRRPQPAGAV